MQVKEQTKKEYYLSSRANAVELVLDLLSKGDSVELSFIERTWMKADDPERYNVTVKFREEIR